MNVWKMVRRCHFGSQPSSYYPPELSLWVFSPTYQGRRRWALEKGKEDSKPMPEKIVLPEWSLMSRRLGTSGSKNRRRFPTLRIWPWGRRGQKVPSIHPPEGLGEISRTGQSFAQAQGFSGPPQGDFPLGDPPVGAGGRPRTPTFVRERESGYGSRRNILEPLDDAEKVSGQSSNTEEVEARDERRERKRDFHPSLISMQQGQSAVFRKSAQPPDEQSLPGGEESFLDEKGIHASFEKRALAPVYPAISSEVREFKDPVPRGGATEQLQRTQKRKLLVTLTQGLLQFTLSLMRWGSRWRSPTSWLTFPRMTGLQDSLHWPDQREPLLGCDMWGCSRTS